MIPQRPDHLLATVARIARRIADDDATAESRARATDDRPSGQQAPQTRTGRGIRTAA
jgi:hypothetical protein